MGIRRGGSLRRKLGGIALAAALLAPITSFAEQIPAQPEGQTDLPAKPELVPLVNTADNEGSPQIRGDRLYYRSGDAFGYATISADAVTLGEPVRGIETLLTNYPVGSIAISPDEKSLLLTSWEHGSNPAENTRLHRSTRQNSLDPFNAPQPIAITYADAELAGALCDPSNIGENGKPKKFEGDASFTNDGGIIFSFSAEDRSEKHNDPAVGARLMASRGKYSAEKQELGANKAECPKSEGQSADQAHKLAEFDAVGIGAVGNLTIFNGDLEAIYTCYNCPGGSGNADLAYADRAKPEGQFQLFDETGKIRFIPFVNTAANESDPSIGESGYGPYLTLNRVLFYVAPSAENGQTEIYRMPLPIDPLTGKLDLRPPTPTQAAPSLDDLIRAAARAELEKRGADVSRISLPQIALEPLVLDPTAAAALRSSMPEDARQVSARYADDARNQWYGTLSIPLPNTPQSYAGLFTVSSESATVKFLEALDKRELRFLHTIMDIRSLGTQAPELEIPADVRVDTIAEDPEAYFAERYAEGKRERKFGKHCDAAQQQMVQTTLATLPQERQNAILSTLHGMQPTELVLAFHLLSAMGNPRYGFATLSGDQLNVDQDLLTQRLRVFRENVTTAAEILRRYSWAQQEAERNWENFVSGVAIPRFSNEYDIGGRQHLAAAVQTLVGDAPTLEEAVSRIARVAPKLFRFSPGYGWEDGNWLDMLTTNRGRCEAMAMGGSLLMRDGGIPNYQAYTPGWADRDGNHAWNVVQYTTSPKPGLAFFSFLAGDSDLLSDGKPNIHGYDHKHPTREAVHIDGIPYVGLGGAPKVYLTMLTPSGRERVDITDQCTVVRDIEVPPPADPQGTAYLNVYNDGAFRAVQDTPIAPNTPIRFTKVGTIPRKSEPHNGLLLPQSEGLLYVISKQQSLDGVSPADYIGHPFILTPTGMLPCEPYQPMGLTSKGIPPSISGLQPTTEYGIVAYAQGQYIDLGKFTADPNGTITAPLREKNLFIGTTKDSTRPYLIRKTTTGALEAVRY